MPATNASPSQGTLVIAPEKAPAGMLAVVVVRNRKTGEGFRHIVADAWLPKVIDWNKTLDPAGRLDAVMTAEGLFEIARIKVGDKWFSFSSGCGPCGQQNPEGYDMPYRAGASHLCHDRNSGDIHELGQTSASHAGELLAWPGKRAVIFSRGGDAVRRPPERCLVATRRQIFYFGHLFYLDAVG